MNHQEVAKARCEGDHAFKLFESCRKQIEAEATMSAVYADALNDE